MTDSLTRVSTSLNLNDIATLIRDKENELNQRLNSNDDEINSVARVELEKFKIDILRKIITVINLQQSDHLSLANSLTREIVKGGDF